MSENVVPIAPGAIIQNSPDEDIVEACEILLARAKTGEIRALAFTSLMHSDAAVSWFKSGQRAEHALVGLIHRLARDVMDEWP